MSDSDHEKVAGEIRPAGRGPTVEEAGEIAKKGGRVTTSGDSGTTAIKYPTTKP